MNLQPNGHEWPAFALQNVDTGEVNLINCVPTEREAMMLLDMQRKHVPHRGRHRIVQVLITVKVDA